jgi:hypothetical protein
MSCDLFDIDGFYFRLSDETTIAASVQDRTTKKVSRMASLTANPGPLLPTP